jgi:hypothetical protein
MIYFLNILCIFRLNSVLSYAEDMEIDIPKIWQYFGELIGPMVQGGSVPLSFLKEACQPLKESGKAGILVAEILHDASDREHILGMSISMSSAYERTEFNLKIQRIFKK